MASAPGFQGPLIGASGAISGVVIAYVMFRPCAKVTVLFMDANQIIQPDESGDPDQVAALAKRLGVKFTRHRLRAQFRCDGSDAYLRWADALWLAWIARLTATVAACSPSPRSSSDSRDWWPPVRWCSRRGHLPWAARPSRRPPAG